MKYYLILLFAIVIVGCGGNRKAEPVQNAIPTNAKQFEVKEVVQTSKYTYIKAYENFAERWVAVTRIDEKHRM